MVFSVFFKKIKINQCGFLLLEDLFGFLGNISIVEKGKKSFWSKIIYNLRNSLIID